MLFIVYCASYTSGVARLWSQGGHRGSGGWKWGPGEEPRWGSGVKPPEARYIQTVCSCQMLFYAGLLPSLSSISPTYPPKKTKNFRAERIPWPNTAEAGWGHVPTPGYAAVIHCWFPALVWVTVVNQHLVCDPTIQQPGFDLPRQLWTLLNRFRADQGPCRANLHKWGLAASELCDCGQRQTMGHIVDSCPLTQLDGRLTRLHEADDDTVTWLKTTAATALAKWN